MNKETDYFSKYLPSNITYSQPQEEKKKLDQKSDKFNFENYLPETFPEENKFDSLLRQGAQYSSRALERVGGFYEDTRNFIKNIVISSYENAALSGREPKKQREAPEWLKNLFESSPGEMGISGPTSSELREISEEITGGYTKPRTFAEEKIGNVIGDITSSLLGGKKSIKNNLFIPLGANLIETAMETANFEKKSQTYGKLGSWFLMGLAANKNANKFAGELQNQARNNIIPNTPFSMQKLGNELRPLNRKWISGDPRSQSAKSQINDIISDIRQNKNTVDDLITRIDAINAEIDLKGGFDYAMKVPKTVRIAEIKNLNKVKGAIYNTLEESLINQPGSFNKFIEAQQATAAIGKSNKFMEFAKKHWKQSASIGLGSLLGGLYFDPTMAAIGSASLIALHKTGQVAMRMAKSPQLKKYYLNAVKASSENNIPVFIQNMEKLDNQMLKEEKKTKKTFKFQES